MKVSLQEWKEYLSQVPNAHLLQTGEWGELKTRFGWHAEHVIHGNVGAQILYRRLPAGLQVGYIAKGPLGGPVEVLQDELDILSRNNNAIFLKVEPDEWQNDGAAGSKPSGDAWRASRTIQPQRTVVVSLSGSEDDILARMKQKTRYNIHLAEKKGVTVTPDADLASFHNIMQLTGARDQFGVHSQAYYRAAYDLFHPLGQCELFTAWGEGKLLASLMVFARGETAWYMYGASTDVLRNWMPTYLLQWKAMLWAKARGCLNYDLWGIPDVDEDALEENFRQHQSHQGLWGVYRFKRGFGGTVRRSAGAFDRVYRPFVYRAYQQVLKWRGGNEE
jgi:lipid II:glycine glycyltransferase (peptidoglycan interpeptide bridge formation enzyme)